MYKYNYDGLDLDYEPGFGGVGPLVGHNNALMKDFVLALSKYFGPKSGTGKMCIRDRIWLNQNSTISYPPTFEGEEERRVYLIGEAYFEVTKNKKSPFYVESEAFNVRVLGTSFNIKSSNMSNISSVTLVNGEIEVKGNNNEGHVTLSPGQKAEINHTDHRLKVYETNAVLDVL